MREIEIKARVADKAELLKQLESQKVVVGDTVIQRDRVWGPKGAVGGNTHAVPWLRIRMETKNGETRQIFTLKKSVTNQMDSIEHETEIADEEELAHIIRHLGFTPYSDTTKTGQKAWLGNIEICIDSVDGLGDFIEAEKLTDEDADYDMVAKELWGVLERFGVSRKDHATDGYDVMTRKAAGLEL